MTEGYLAGMDYMDEGELAGFQDMLKMLCQETYGLTGDNSNDGSVNGTATHPCDNLTAFANTLSGSLDDYPGTTDDHVELPLENIIVPIIFGTTLVCGKSHIQYILSNSLKSSSVIFRRGWLPLSL